MSLAEELLADLEEPDDIHDQLQAEILDNNEMESIDDAIDDADMDEAGGGGLYERVTAVARLRDSEQYKSIMANIENAIASPRSGSLTGPVEHDPEYRLIVDANNLTVSIDNEINVIHKFVRDKYAKRFPELESLVPMPMEYISCVKELGNEVLEKAKNNETLQKILLPATVIVVSVTASTTQGEPLTPEELAVVSEACQMAIELNGSKVQIFEFVESRMTKFAPNLSAIVGSGTAAQIMGVAGGLMPLSKMPACNLMLLGAQKKMLSGFSTATLLPHTGFVYYSPLVQSLPRDLHRKAARLVSAKCALAARVDAQHECSDAAAGQKFHKEILTKFEKLLEPPPVKQTKALPKPIDVASKKRGGRRVRKMKERMGMSEMRKKANRMNFGELEEDIVQDSVGFGVGHLKGSSGGRIRSSQVDEKTRARMSKGLSKSVSKANQAHGGVRSTVSSHGGGFNSVRRQSGMVSGTASSVTFTPVQGLEIVNPHAAENLMDGTKSTYFSSTSGFMKIQTPLPRPQ